MQTDLRGRDLITLSDWSTEEIETALDVAFDLKLKRALGEPHPYLRDKVLAMLFFYSSTRTRASFEAGMAQLGGHAQFIESKTTQIAHGDTAKEIGEILGRYNDGIAIRNVDWGVGNGYIREVAEASRVPVLNMQCDIYHPFQILADLMTMREKLGQLRGRRITISWAYAKSYQKPISVPQDLLLAATRFGMEVRLVHPPEFELMPAVMDEARGAEIAGRYTDWITDERRMAMAADHAIYMHPLPADRNIEVTDGVIDGPHSVVYDEAENRLHAQKAVMALTMR
jgi:ornithine carbamoyltransferase